MRYRHVFMSLPGDLLHFKVLGQHMVVLGSPDAMFELLEKRSANTSDRQQVPLINLSVRSFFPSTWSSLDLSHQDRDERQPLGDAVRTMVETTQTRFLAAFPPRSYPILSADTTQRSTQIPQQAPEDAFEVTRAYPFVSVPFML